MKIIYTEQREFLEYTILCFFMENQSFLDSSFWKVMTHVVLKMTNFAFFPKIQFFTRISFLF